MNIAAPNGAAPARFLNETTNDTAGAASPIQHRVSRFQCRVLSSQQLGQLRVGMPADLQIIVQITGAVAHRQISRWDGKSVHSFGAGRGLVDDDAAWFRAD